jgi:hypothetical protein
MTLPEDVFILTIDDRSTKAAEELKTSSKEIGRSQNMQWFLENMTRREKI